MKTRIALSIGMSLLVIASVLFISCFKPAQPARETATTLSELTDQELQTLIDEYYLQFTANPWSNKGEAGRTFAFQAIQVYQNELILRQLKANAQEATTRPDEESPILEIYKLTEESQTGGRIWGICPECGAIGRNGGYCSICGAEMVFPSPCEFCSYELEVFDSYCPNCGKPTPILEIWQAREEK